MQKLNRPQLKKIAWYMLSSSLGLIVLSLAAASYFFLHLDDYQPKIKSLLAAKTGWQVNFSAIHSQFNQHWQPALQIDNFSLQAKTQKKPLIQIKRINLALSYTSLTKLQPILSLLAIEGSQLDFEYLKNGDLLLNQLLLTNLNTPSTATFDWQTPLLAQQRITLKQIDLKLKDTQHQLPPLVIKNLNIDLSRHKRQQHILAGQAQFNGSNLQLNWQWSGNSLYAISQWQHAAISLKNSDRLGYLVNFSSKIVAGKIIYLQGEFNNNQHKLAVSSDKQQDLQQVQGSIQIESTTANTYRINARNLSIKSNYGYLLKQANIHGDYILNRAGELNVNNINFNNLSNLIRYQQLSNKLNLNGNIAKFTIKWLGSLTSPQAFSLATSFSDLEIKSTESDIPSLNNIKGELMATKSHAQIKLALTNSQLNYPKQLYKNLLIQSFTTSLNWQYESATQNQVSWSNSKLKTKDLLIASAGGYQQLTESITAQLHISYLDLANLANYLPKVVPPAGISYLRQSLLNGSLENGDLIIHGNPAQIPFQNGGGQLTFTGNLKNIKFKFAPEWGALSQINANLKVKNQQLALQIKSGKIANNKISDSSVKLTDLSQTKPNLQIHAKISGLSENYLDYLQDSPFKGLVSNFHQKVRAGGSSSLSLDLKLPLANPNRLKLKGSYNLQNNRLSLIDPSLEISSINGTVHFSETGLEKSSISATAFQSQLQLTAFNNSQMQLNSADLDYSALASLLSPQADEVIHGRAPIHISYDLNNSDLLIQSSLYGVSLDGAEPLTKAPFESRELQISLHPAADKLTKEVNLNYADLLYSHASLTNSMSLKKLQIALGTSDYQLERSSAESTPITVKAQLENAYLVDWVKMINKLMPQKPAPELIRPSAPAPAASSLFPVKIEITSNGFWLDNYNLDRGYADLLIESQQVSGAIQTPDINGNLTYLSESQQLAIKLDKFLYSSANLVKPEASISLVKQDQRLAPKPFSAFSLPKTTININNFYYQNHYLGKLGALIYQESSAVYLESGSLSNTAGLSRFNLSDQCFGCGESRETLSLLLRSDINNFGLLLNKLDFGDSFSKGSGQLELAMSYNGELAKFNYKTTNATASLKIKNVELTHVKPGLFGALLGVVTMNTAFSGVDTLTTFATTGKVNMNALFGNSIVFDSLDSNVVVQQDDVIIKNLTMEGNMLGIHTFGNIYLESNTIDTYLSVEPKVGTTLATTVGIVTLNPLIGFMVYFGNQLLDNPQNKALAVSFHVQGDFESPTMTKTDLRQQLIQNVGSSINVFKQ